MKLGDKGNTSWDQILFSLSGKPFDGYGPSQSPAALGQIRSCELNCYLGEGGDCCESQEMCERGSCVAGSICDPDGKCVSITRPEFEDEYGGVDCTENPDACRGYSDEPCATGFTAQARQCPKDVFFVCLPNVKTGTSSCKWVEDTLLDRAAWCFTNTCYDSKEECYACDGCACQKSPPSSSSSYEPSSSSSCDPSLATDETMGTCYYYRGTSLVCQPMSLGACKNEENWYDSSGPGYGNPTPPADSINLPSGTNWSCSGECANQCDPMPTCSSGSSVKTTYTSSLLGGVSSSCECVPDKPCGNTQCTSCEVCCGSECIRCNDQRRYLSFCSDGCPQPLGDEVNSCGCNSNIIPGNGTGTERGCGTCEFCMWDTAAQGGMCLPCEKSIYGYPYDPNTDQYHQQQIQCSPECINPPGSSSTSVCVWTFTANYDDQTQAWSLEGSSPAGPECLSQPLSFDLNSWSVSHTQSGCKTRMLKTTTNECFATGDCVAPSPSEYPALPTGPADCGPWYSCDYSWDSATNNTTYSCKQQESWSSEYYGSPEECEAAKASGSCIPPTFNCKLKTDAPTEFECVEVGFNSGDYKTFEDCTTAIANSDCGYKFSCKAPAKSGDPYTCVPDSNGDFASRSICESNLGSCGKFKCDSGWGCIQDPYGTFNSKEECEKGCCYPTPGEPLSPTALGSCEYYQADGFSPLTPDYVICEAGITKSGCDAKPTVTTLSGSWSPTWTCGSDCYAGQHNCPDCPSGNYKIVRSYPAGTPICTCQG